MQTESSIEYSEIYDKQYHHDVNKKMKQSYTNEIASLETTKQHHTHLPCCDSKISSCMQYHRDKKTTSLKHISLNEIDLSNFPRCASSSSTKFSTTDTKTNKNSNGNNKNNNKRKVCNHNNKNSFHKGLRRFSDPTLSSSGTILNRRQSMASQTSLRSLREELKCSITMKESCDVGNTTIDCNNNDNTNKRKFSNRHKSRRYIRRWDSESKLITDSEHSKIQNESTFKQRRCSLESPVVPPNKIFLQLQITPQETNRKGLLSSRHPDPDPSSCPTGRKDIQEHPRIVVQTFPRPPPVADEQYGLSEDYQRPRKSQSSPDLSTFDESINEGSFSDINYWDEKKKIIDLFPRLKNKRRGVLKLTQTTES